MVKNQCVCKNKYDSLNSFNFTCGNSFELEYDTQFSIYQEFQDISLKFDDYVYWYE